MPRIGIHSGCNCCELSGGFIAYQNCTLRFVLRYCGNFDEGSLTFSVTGPSGADATPYFIEGNVLRWNKFKPAIGVWTIDVSYTCESGDTFTKQYEYTVASGDDFSCNCCQTKTPSYVVISGHCCGFGTRTIALTQSGFCTYTGQSSVISAPASPCSTFCFSFFMPQLNETFYASPLRITVQLQTDTTLRARPTLFVEFRYWIFSINNGQCIQRDDGVTATHAYRYDLQCSDGPGTYAPSLDEGSDGRWITDGFNNLFIYPCTSAPDVRIAWN